MTDSEALSPASPEPGAPVQSPTSSRSATAKSMGKTRTWKQWFVRTFLIYVVLPYVAIAVLMTVNQRSLIYQPRKTKTLEVPSMEVTSAPVQEILLQTADGLTLRGWHYHATETPRDADPFLVLYFPGNAGCRADRFLDCRDFTDLGCDVILFDYRGYGDNPGSPTEALIASDARQIWRMVADQRLRSARRVLLYGESLGGAVATRLASELSEDGDPPAALVLNSTFASLGETVTWHYPMFPFRYLLLDHFQSDRRIPHVCCPILQFHGTADDIVAYQHGRRLFDAAPAHSAERIPKRFVTIEGGQHNFIGMGQMKQDLTDLLLRLSPVSPERREKMP